MIEVHPGAAAEHDALLAREVVGHPEARRDCQSGCGESLSAGLPRPGRKMPFSALPLFGTSVPKALVVFTPRN